MGIYFHGTSQKNGTSILEHGFQNTGESNGGKHFGDGYYFADSLESASEYGDVIIKVAIDDSSLKKFSSMDDFNNYDIQALFFGGLDERLLSEGYKGFKLTTINSKKIVKVLDGKDIMLIEN